MLWLVSIHCLTNLIQKMFCLRFPMHCRYIKVVMNVWWMHCPIWSQHIYTLVLVKVAWMCCNINWVMISIWSMQTVSVWGLLVIMCDPLWPRDCVSFIIGFYLIIYLMKSDILEVRCGLLANESILIINHYMLSTYLYFAHNSICCISYVINIYCVV